MKGNQRWARCLDIADLRAAARRRAHPLVFDYIDGGADEERTLRRNSDAFSEYELLFRVLVGVDSIDTSTTLLGHKIPSPFFTSPSGGNRLFHTAGERAVARAASAAGLIYCLSTLSSVSIEEVARIVPGPKWFQCYVWKDRSLVRDMLKRAREAGFSALILTVDLPVHGNRMRDTRNGFTIPPKIGARQIWDALRHPAWTWDYLLGEPIRYANLAESTAAMSLTQFVAQQLNAGFNWADAEWLLGEWNGPAVIKGIVRADDAKRAVAAGFNAIMVSNHGGRQLDDAPAPIDVLEDVVCATGGGADVILDGGVRRGTDVLKALALGARAVSFARPYLYGLAAGGEAGVERALAILSASLRRDMALLGVRRIADIDRSCVRRKGSQRRAFSDSPSTFHEAQATDTLTAAVLASAGTDQRTTVRNDANGP
jgi:L-lactate dehydrogenase (cytochrome)